MLPPATLAARCRPWCKRTLSLRIFPALSQETARAKAYKEKQAPPGKKVTPFWAKAPREMAEDLVGGTSYESDDEKEMREKTATGMSRAKAMSAAARRWRDASRAG